MTVSVVSLPYFSLTIFIALYEKVFGFYCENGRTNYLPKGIAPISKKRRPTIKVSFIQKTIL